MLEIEVIGIDAAAAEASAGAGAGADALYDDDGPTAFELEQLCALALSSSGIEDGHVAIELVGEDRIRDLNRDHRGVDAPTDVLSFGVDENGPCAGPREVGDIVICPAHTEDLREAVVHGALHLSGMDHERDDGEMLALGAELMRWVR